MWPFEATLCFRAHPHQPAWLLLTLPPAAWLACPALITGSTQQPTNPSNRETRPILCTVWQIIIKSNSSRSQTDSRLKGIHKVQQTLFNSSALKKKAGSNDVQGCPFRGIDTHFESPLKPPSGLFPEKFTVTRLYNHKPVDLTSVISKAFEGLILTSKTPSLPTGQWGCHLCGSQYSLLSPWQIRHVSVDSSSTFITSLTSWWTNSMQQKGYKTLWAQSCHL